MIKISKETREAANRCTALFTYRNDIYWADLIAEAIQEALDNDRVSIGWQPINGAPRGGVEFQAWIQSYGWEPRARYDKEEDIFQLWDGELGWQDKSAWMIPTHYMLLPVGPDDE